MSVEGKMRLNRYIARCGASSRREADVLIEAGRVMVNGGVCRDHSVTVAPGKDAVALDGAPLVLPDLLYFKFYKPRGVVTTLDDPQGRESISELLKANDIPAGVVPAGRLDRDSEGLLILTNDGDALQRLTHPRHEVEKVYRVLIDRRPSETDLDALRKGVKCEGYVAKARRIARMGPQPPDDEHPVRGRRQARFAQPVAGTLYAGYWLEMVMGEGRKREIREMLGALGFRVLRLVRIAHGPITVGTLKPGEVRALNDEERNALAGKR
jgi:23S rRNA pseudouridine2605 synthase